MTRLISKTRAVVISCIVGLATNALGQCPEGVRSFLRYDGTWMLNVKAVDGHDRQSKLTKIENRCRVDGPFVSCLQTVDDKSKMLVLYRPGPGPCEFNTTEIPEGQGDASTGLVQVEGDVWTYPWTEEQHGIKTRFLVRNVFVGPHLIRYEKSSSTDGKNWTPLEVGDERRR